MDLVAPTFNTGRILLVEDDPAQARLLGLWLRSGGFEVQVCPDGDRAVELIEHAPFDLVISDVHLPGISGLEVLKRCKARWPDAPAMLLTAHDEGRIASKAIDRGVDTYLIKPVGRTVLVDRVRALVEKGRAARARRPVVLAIGAHPDDVEIGCGGVLLAHREAGAEVAILTLSQGACGGTASHRAEESRRAARRLGATLILGDLEDTRIGVDGATVGVIEDAIRRVGPTVVYTHSANDLHQDHRAVHEASLIAARAVPEVLCYQSPSSTTSFQPQRFVDIGRHLEEKVALLRCYGSQSRRPYLQDDYVRAQARYWGRFGGWRPVEALEVVRDAAGGLRIAS